MKIEKHFLNMHYEGRLSNNGHKPYLTTYLLDNYQGLEPDRKRPIVIICPGGGYNHLSVREAEPVAVRMNALGFHAAIVTYSLAPMDFPCAWCDAAEAVHYAREHASEWNVDPHKIILAGFSAGGHTAAAVGTLCASEPFRSILPYPAESIRPDALLLCYPVITSDERFCHAGSVKDVLGKDADNQKLRSLISLEHQVSEKVPPVFMWHTDADEAVPAENSLSFACALRQHHVPLEYHLFARGRHGLSLATGESSTPDGKYVEKECQIWPELFRAWVDGLWN